MTATVFITVLAFASWDDCQNFMHAHDLHETADIECEAVEVDAEPTRPRMRPTRDMEKN